MGGNPLPPQRQTFLEASGLGRALLHRLKGTFGSHEVWVPHWDAPCSPSGMLSAWGGRRERRVPVQGGLTVTRSDGDGDGTGRASFG